MTRGTTLFRLTTGAALVAAVWAWQPLVATAASPGQPPATAVEAPRSSAHRFHDDHVLGTSFDAVVMAPDAASARRAIDAAHAEIARLDKILSSHRADSELARLNADPAAAIDLSPDLFAVIEAAERWRAATDRAFSGRLGRVIAEWQTAAADDLAPAADRLSAEAQRADTASVRLDPSTLRIERPAGLQFALDAIAKGYVIDAAAAAARRVEPQLAGLMLDIGGDVLCWGDAPDGRPWRIGVADATRAADNAAPAARLALQSGAIATSGRGARDWHVAGSGHSHLVAPATGLPAATSASATVIAARTADADALATAFSVMPVAASLALADRLPGVAVLLQTPDGRAHASTRWPASMTLAQSEPAARFWQTAAGDAAAGPAWPAGFVANVAYEVPKIAAETYRAPYVTIWITDANKQLVRTLLVLGEKPKWIDSNYVWWRRYGRKLTGLDSIAKPTRQPGRYTIDWDGLTDDGKPAGQGKYLVHVEASREHGSHTYQSFELDLGGAAVEKSLPAKEEMGAVRVAYGKSS